MKNPNGYGSITKLKGNRRKPFIARAPTRFDKHGNETRPIIGYFVKREEALRALAEFNKAPATKINITLEQLYLEWKETRDFTQISRDTQNNYTAAWNKRLHVLKSQKVKDIRTGQLQAIIDNAEIAGLSHSSMTKDKALMTLLFNYALENDIVHKNYAKFVTLPAADNTDTRDAYSDIEIATIEKAAKKIPFADCILMLCYTGFRIQEFLTLTPFSYDRINKTLTGGMKTPTGKNRTIPIHPKIQKYVDKWISKNGKTLICKDDGSPYKVKYFREECYYSAIEQIDGVRRLSPHCCRHTFATMCHRAGVDPIEVRKLMGHKKYSMTAHYTHTDLERLKNAVNAL